MRFKNQWSTEWRKRFALFPTNIDGGVIVWLEWYEERYVPGKPSEKLCCIHVAGVIERKLL